MQKFPALAVTTSQEISISEAGKRKPSNFSFFFSFELNM